MEIEEALERFLVQLLADGRSVHSVKQYRRHVLLLSRWLATARMSLDEVEHLDHEVIARFLISPMATVRRGAKPKTPGSMNALRSSIRGFCGYVYRSGLSEQDASRLVRRARCTAPPPRALSPEEQKRLLQALSSADGPEEKRDAMLFRLMLATGVRLGSAVGIDVEDVNLDKSEILLRTTKGDRPCSVILGRAIRGHLRRYIRGRTMGPLFTAHGRRVSARHVQRRFTQWLKKAGITRQVGCHALRHSFAMGLYERTGDVLVVQGALGHRSLASSLIYARATDERVRQALRA